MKNVIKVFKIEIWVIIITSLILTLVISSASATTTTLSRTSLDSSGTQANNSSSEGTTSADGRYFVFKSGATNLVTSDTNGKDDIFLKDTDAGTTTRVSVDESGSQLTGNFNVYKPYISGNGRYVVYDTNNKDVFSGIYYTGIETFRYDTETGDIDMVSEVGGAQANGNTFTRGVSHDGRFVLLWSSASNLVTGDTNGKSDLFVKDMKTGDFIVVNQDSSGDPAGDVGGGASLSCDGLQVSFTSWSSSIVDGDTYASSSEADVFLADVRNGYSITNITTGTNGGAQYTDISCEGSHVAFDSTATDLIASDTNNKKDVFVYNTGYEVISRASETSGGAGGNNDSYQPLISDNGEFVLFTSVANNLDTSAGYFVYSQVYRKDMVTSDVELISRELDGTAPIGASVAEDISFDGSASYFRSSESTFVTGDTNSASDVFKVVIE